VFICLSLSFSISLPLYGDYWYRRDVVKNWKWNERCVDDKWNGCHHHSSVKSWKRKALGRRRSCQYFSTLSRSEEVRSSWRGIIKAVRMRAADHVIAYHNIIIWWYHDITITSNECCSLAWRRMKCTDTLCIRFEPATSVRYLLRWSSLCCMAYFTHSKCHSDGGLYIFTPFLPEAYLSSQTISIGHDYYA